ncbi:MAG: hypothetical protein GX804_03220, partial [Lentisphaerae bacterium]|nr:hypothetical protein [Lentisphaerota bacterium]
MHKITAKLALTLFASCMFMSMSFAEADAAKADKPATGERAEMRRGRMQRGEGQQMRRGGQRGEGQERRRPAEGQQMRRGQRGEGQERRAPGAQRQREEADQGVFVGTIDSKKGNKVTVKNPRREMVFTVRKVAEDKEGDKADAAKEVCKKLDKLAVGDRVRVNWVNKDKRFIEKIDKFEPGEGARFGDGA